MGKEDTPKRIDVETTKQGGKFLFELPEDESQGLDMRTIIKSDKMVKTLLYYAIMGDSEMFGSKSAKIIKDTMERMLISFDGIGRTQAVEVLRQSFPKRIEVDSGTDNSFE